MDGPRSPVARGIGLVVSILLGITGLAVAGAAIGRLLVHLDLIRCIELDCLGPPVVGLFVGAAIGLVWGVVTGIRLVRGSSWSGFVALVVVGGGAAALAAIARVTE